MILPTILMVIGVCTSALADKRVALVVGNGSYQNVPTLPNPPNDASDTAASLQRLGFSVTTLTDAGFDDMRRGLLDFGRKARDADMAIVFYAGHGMEIGGENWLIPVDAELRTDTDAENEAISLHSVMLQVAGATNLGLIILDACRNNPFAAKMQRSLRLRAVERGLVRTEPTDNVLVAFAAKDGTTANDGDGRNSPFTAALLKNLETPGLEINFMFRNVRDDVMAATKRAQQPFVYGSLSKEAIYLIPPNSDQAAVAPVEGNPGLRPAVVDAALVSPPAAPRFNEAAVRALAAKQGVPLPGTIKLVSPSSAAPRKAVEYLGAWGGNQRWGRGGRQMILVVTNIDDTGAAIGLIAHGPPTPKTPNQNPANYVSFAGAVTDHGLTFEAYGGNWHYTFQLRQDGLMEGRASGPKNIHPTITIERID